MLVRSQYNEKITDRIEFLIAEIPEKGWGVYQPDHYRVFAKYSTFEKAIKSLDFVEQAYIVGTYVFQFPAEEEIPDEE